MNTARARDPQMLRVGGRTIELSATDKVLFPDEGFTKGDLVEYYRKIAPLMLPHLRDRPLAMERFPDGLGGEGFFQKDIPDYFPGWIGRLGVMKQGGRITQVVCNDAATLVYLANQACITPHVWLSRKDRLDDPDQLIFDLDPAGSDLTAVCRAARALREIFGEVGLAAFVKTTGSRGLHVVAPLDRSADFETSRSLAQDLALVLENRFPREFTTEQRKSKRRGRVYLDVMRNAYAQTAAPPYAVRARPGAPVATPLEWDELQDCRLVSRRYTIRNIFRRLGNQKSDPWLHMAPHAKSASQARRHLDRLMKDEKAKR